MAGARVSVMPELMTWRRTRRPSQPESACSCMCNAIKRGTVSMVRRVVMLDCCRVTVIQRHTDANGIGVAAALNHHTGQRLNHRCREVSPGAGWRVVDVRHTLAAVAELGGRGRALQRSVYTTGKEDDAQRFATVASEGGIRRLQGRRCDALKLPVQAVRRSVRWCPPPCSTATTMEITRRVEVACFIYQWRTARRHQNACT